MMNPRPDKYIKRSAGVLKPPLAADEYVGLKTPEPFQLPDDSGGISDDPRFQFDTGNAQKNLPFQLPDDNSNSLATAYEEVKDLDSDEAAKILKYSKDTGLDPAYVGEHLKEVEDALGGYSESQLREIERNHPKTGAYLRKKRMNLVVAKDSLAEMGEFEQNINSVKEFLEMNSRAFTAGKLGEEAALLNYEKMDLGLRETSRDPDLPIDNLGPNPRIGEIDKRLFEIESELPKLKSSIPSGWSPAAISAQVSEFMPQIIGNAVNAAMGGFSGATIGAGFGIPVTAAMGATAGAAFYNFRMMAGMAYGASSKVLDDQGKPLSEENKQIRSLVMGAIGAGLGVKLLKSLLLKIPGGAQAFSDLIAKYGSKGNLNRLEYSAIIRDFLASWGKTTAHGALTMGGLVGADLATLDIAKVLSGQNFTNKGNKPLTTAEIMSQSTDAGIDAIKTFGALGLLAPIGMAGLKRLERTRPKEYMERLLNTKPLSKLLKRSPDVVEEFVKDLVDDSALAKVKVPIEDFELLYQKKGLDPAVEAHKLGAFESYLEAKETGGNVEIPYEKIIRDPEILKAFGKDIKLYDEDSTENETARNEIEEAAQQKLDEADTADQLDESKEIVANDVMFSEFKERVKNNISTQMKSAGQIQGTSEREWLNWIEHNAEVFSSIAVTQAKRRGIEPNLPALDAFWDQVRPHVLGETQDIPINIKTDVLRRILDEISQGEHTSGGFVPLADSDLFAAGVEANQFVPGTSTFPKYFKDRGLTKKEAVTAFQKKIDGKPLTQKQENLVNDLYRWSEYDQDLETGNAPSEGEDLFQRPPEKVQTLFKFPEEVKVIQADSGVLGKELFKKSDHKDQKKQDRKISVQYAKDHFQGKKFLNNHTKWGITISGEGIKEAKSHAITPEHLIGMAHLDKIIEEAVYLDSKEDFKKREHVLAYHRFYGFIEIDGKSHLYKLVVRETAQGKKFWDHVIVEGGEPIVQREGINPEGHGQHLPNKLPILNIDHLFERINRERKQDPLFQSDVQGVLGSYAPAQKVIRLLKDANKSTFMHESAHLWLKDIEDYVRGRATEQYVKDFKTISDWVGAKDGEKLSVEQQEKFARGFEQYLREGKAPTSALRKAFESFKKWLMKVYRYAKQLDAELNNDVRAVFDNLVASEEDISFAEQEAGFFKEIDTSSLSPELQEKVHGLYQSVHDRAAAEHAAMRTPEALAAKLVEATKLAKGQVDDLGLFQAGEALSERFEGADYRELSRKFIEDLKKAPDELPTEDFLFLVQYAEVLNNLNLDPELTAQELGFGPVKDEMISKLADQIFNDQNSRAELARKAVHNYKRLEVLALEQQILEEQRSNKKKINKEQYKLRAQEAKSLAKSILDSKKVSEAIAFRPYFTAERNAAVKSAKALDRGDLEGAARFKKQQVLNHALATEAIRNSKEVGKAYSRLKYFEKRGKKLLNIPYGSVRQIDELLVRNGLSERDIGDVKPMQQRAIQMKSEGAEADLIADTTGYVQVGEGSDTIWRQETLAQFIQRQSESNLVLEIPSFILEENQKKSSELTLSQLRDVRDTANQIYGVGRDKDKFNSAEIKEGLTQASQEAAVQIRDLWGNRHGDKRNISAHIKSTKLKEAFKRVMEIPDWFGVRGVNVLTICDVLSGGDRNSPMHKYFYRVLKSAEDKKLIRIQETKEKFKEILNKNFTPKEFESLRSERVPFDFLGKDQSLTRNQILAMVLNQGNDGNKSKLKAGWLISEFDAAGKELVDPETKIPNKRTITQEEIDLILNEAPKKYWDHAQDVWDLFASFTPEVSALEMKVTKTQMPLVKAVPIANEHGTYRGGYYPLDYDFGNSVYSYNTLEQRNALYKEHSAVGAYTAHGHTKPRVANVTLPVRLDTKVIGEALENVLHDLSLREAVIDANRFLKQPAVRTAISDALGKQALMQMENAIKWLAADQRESLTPVESMMRSFREPISTYALGFKFIAIPIDASTGFMQALTEVGPKNLSLQVGNTFFNLKSAREFVHEKSPSMKQREILKDRDIKDFYRNFSGESNKKNILMPQWLVERNFWTQVKADELISLPMWQEIYHHAIGKGESEKTAVHMADEAVTRVFGSGSQLNLSGFQRGGEAQKLMTMFYYYSSMRFNSLWRAGKIAGLEFRNENYGKAALAVSGMVALTLSIGTLEAIWKDYAFKNSDRNHDADWTLPELATKAATRALKDVTGTVPVLRDLADYGIDKAIHGRAEFHTVLGQSTKLIDPLVDGLFKKNLPPDFFERTVLDAVALATGTPNEIHVLILAFIKALNNDPTLNWKDFIQKRTRN